MASQVAQQQPDQNEALVKVYDDYAAGYDEFMAQDPSTKDMTKFIRKWDWKGTVLDVACGTGLIAALIRELSPSSKLLGSDISPGMAAVANAKGVYSEEVQVSTLQETLATVQPTDHVVCLGVTCYLDAAEFAAAMDAMLRVARRSVTVSVYDFAEDYLASRKTYDDEMKDLTLRNNVAEWRKWAVPPGWSLVASDRIVGYFHAGPDVTVYQYAIRYERLSHTS